MIHSLNITSKCENNKSQFHAVVLISLLFPLKQSFLKIVQKMKKIDLLTLNGIVIEWGTIWLYTWMEGTLWNNDFALRLLWKNKIIRVKEFVFEKRPFSIRNSIVLRQYYYYINNSCVTCSVSQFLRGYSFLGNFTTLCVSNIDIKGVYKRK